MLEFDFDLLVIIQCLHGILIGLAVVYAPLVVGASG
jgi:hypothetical protein